MEIIVPIVLLGLAAGLMYLFTNFIWRDNDNST